MDREQEFYNRGLEKAQAGDFVEAVREFDRVLRINPQFVEAYYKRGRCRFELGDTTGALVDYNQALQLQPERTEIYLSRGLTKLALKDNAGALADAEQSLKLNHNLAAAYSLQGTALRRLGNLAEAIACFKQAANIYLAEKDKQNCQRCIDNITEIQAEQNRAKTALATHTNFYYQVLQKVQRGELRQAWEDLNWLIQTDPNDAQAHSYRGMVLSKLGYHQQAIADLNKALQLNTQNLQAYSYRAIVRIEIGDYGGAINDCNQALQIDPNYIDAYIYRGNAHHKSANHHLAIEDYSRVIKEKSDDPQAYYHRAAARLDFEDLKGAIDDYQQAANIYFNRGDWQKYREALDQIKKVQSRPQRSPRKDSSDYFSQAKSTSLTELQNQLIRLVGGYRDIADRLVDIARYKYPGMPEEWYWEKAIQDLENDR
ncbi:tetratricopeptide repeat protein [Floridanema evergladense]|uniref:Tetratricopeptide repeat protein n=1 Tax=Floridaenema evergladense BLCC-F167 TaxID=3153639 RepID=A0ABV4WPU2_9CYAN